MRLLDDSGVAYLWEKIKNKLTGKVDKVDGKGLSTNDFDNTAKNKVDKIVLNGSGNNYLADDGTYKPSFDPSGLEARIEGLESMGQYVGTFDTYADIPTNKSDFSVITLNDFINVRNDENNGGSTTRYVASAIDRDTGAITWTYDITYWIDTSGKMDKVNNPVKDRLLIDNGSGNAVDSDIGITELMNAVNSQFRLLPMESKISDLKKGAYIFQELSTTDGPYFYYNDVNTDENIVDLSGLMGPLYVYKDYADVQPNEVFASGIFQQSSNDELEVNRQQIYLFVLRKTDTLVEIDKAKYTSFVTMATPQTISGKKTFTSIPTTKGCAPKVDGDLVHKKYVDDQIKTFETITNEEIDAIVDTEAVNTSEETI